MILGPLSYLWPGKEKSADFDRLELLQAFEDFEYPNDIGPGVYDIHSPNVPAAETMVQLIRRAARTLPVERLRVNPDCSLKTRRWPEIEAALQQMVKAAKILRQEYAGRTTRKVATEAAL